MKIRNGFVSNSSSSSFIVICKNFFDNVKVRLSEEEEKSLVKFGFKKTLQGYSSNVGSDDFEGINSETFKKEIEKHYNYGYSVSCNQDDVIYFLLKNNISFEASCHYNDYHVIYTKGEQDFLEVQNFGEQAARNINYEIKIGQKSYSSVFSDNSIFSLDLKNPVTKVNVKKYLEEQEEFQKDLDKIDENDIVIESDQKDNED